MYGRADSRREAKDAVHRATAELNDDGDTQAR
jgi:hypothetical protein